MDWPAAFRVLSHEMRSPTAVISGYARMLQEGRLDEAGRSKAIEQIQRANAVLGQLSRQASDLGLWIARPTEAAATGVALVDLVDHAVAQVAPPATITVDLAPEAGTRMITSADKGALSTAILGLIDAARREAGPHASLAVIAPRAESADASGQDVVVGPCTADEARGLIGAPADRAPLSIERGGLGLALVVAVAVLEAHGLLVWQLRDRPAIIGFTMPAGS